MLEQVKEEKLRIYHSVFKNLKDYVSPVIVKIFNTIFSTIERPYSKQFVFRNTEGENGSSKELFGPLNFSEYARCIQNSEYRVQESKSHENTE